MKKFIQHLPEYLVACCEDEWAIITVFLRSRILRQEGAGFINKPIVTMLAVFVVLAVLSLTGVITVRAFTSPAPVVLGTAGNFAVLAGAGITDTTPSEIIGNAGSYPTVSNGLPDGEVTGTNYTAGGAIVSAAKDALSTAYADVSTRAQSGADIPTNLGTQNLTPGVYHAASGTFGITGGQTLTLDGDGNPNAVFIFKTDTTLVTGNASSVVLTNGAQACNVFWAVGSAVTLDHTTFVGTIMANTEAITDSGSSTINGRLLAKTAAVTLNNTHVTVPTCAPSLLLQKTIAGGGPDLNTAWTLKANGAGGSPTNLSGITGATGANSDLQFSNATFKADTYTLAETGPSTNYVATYSCANVNNGVTTTTTSSSITLVAGDKATCIITNTYTAPATTTLKLVKEVTNNNGGIALNTAWTLTATGAGGFVDNGGTGIFHTVTAGVGYVLSESTVAGYTAGNWSCNGGSLSGSTITLSSGQNVTCTITNDDIPPGTAILHVIKHVITDNGGTAVAGNWNLAVTSSNSGTGTGSAVGLESPGTTYTLQADHQYSVAESGGVSGYTPSSTGDCTIAAAVASTTYTCTITNDDIAPQLTVNKVVVNDNGRNKVIADFPLFINGALVDHGAVNTFSVGSYVVTETTDPNYNQTFSGSCPNGHIDLALGDIKTCTITNDDIVPQASGGGSGSYTPPIPPLIDLVKVPSPLALPNGSGPVTYTYTLKNIGTVPVTNITMVGDTCSPIVLVSGDTNADSKLDVNEVWVHTCSTTLTATHTNIVTATGWANGISAVDIASATVVVGASIVPPLIHVTKVPSVFILSAPGGAVTYTYTVTNPGTAALSNVSITDDKCTGLPGRVVGHPGDINKNNLLESNETWVFTCQTKLTQTTTNTGTAEGSANGLTARDFAIATVVVAASVPKFPNTGFTPDLNEFLKMDIFFVIASIASIILAILLIILLIYSIKFVRNLKYISDKARIGIDSIRTTGLQLKHLISFFSSLIKSNKKGK